MASDKASKLKDRARKGWHRITVPHHCGDCNKDYRTVRAMNAHHMSVHAGLWGSKKARAAGRGMGKKADAARRHAMGWRVAAGLAEVRGQRVVATDKSRTRPVLSGHLRVRDLRAAHKHDRDHNRAQARDLRADRAAARGKATRARKHQHRADYLRSKHGTPARPAPRQARPAPATRPAPAASGHVNGQLNGRTARTPARTRRTRT